MSLRFPTPVPFGPHSHPAGKEPFLVLRPSPSPKQNKSNEECGVEFCSPLVSVVNHASPSGPRVRARALGCLKPANEKLADGQLLRITGRFSGRNHLSFPTSFLGNPRSRRHQKQVSIPILEVGSTIILCCFGLSCLSVKYFSVFRALLSVFNHCTQ